MRNPALNEKRNQQILADVVRAYIETGAPVSSRVIARRHPEELSSATIRSVMAQLEEDGYLYQPHTSAGRVPTAAAYRFFAPQIASRATLEHLRFLLLPDERVVVVLVSSGGNARDKVLRTERRFTQAELDRTAEYLNHHYVGWTLEAIRVDLLARLATERERYDRLSSNALMLCDPSLLADAPGRQIYVEGAAQFATAPEFADQG